MLTAGFSGRLSFVLQKCFLWNETQSRMDAYCSVFCTFGGSGPVGVATDEFGKAFAPKFRICF